MMHQHLPGEKQPDREACTVAKRLLVLVALAFRARPALAIAASAASAAIRQPPLRAAQPLRTRVVTTAAAAASTGNAATDVAPETGIDNNEKGTDVVFDAGAETVVVLAESDRHVVVAKPPSVVCHHSDYAGSRRRNRRRPRRRKRGEQDDEEEEEEEEEVPMLQRVRDATGRKVNLIHRLDRGASGCLLLAYADADDNESSMEDAEEDGGSLRGVTALLSDALASTSTTKTYLALVRGQGIFRGDDLKTRGWFVVDRPIKDERCRLNDAETSFLFVAGQTEDDATKRPRASLVLARPKTGRWHQVRRHLNGLGHPILGDSSHGSTSTNREWRKSRGMPGERTCLHLARLEMQPCSILPEGMDVSCPLQNDMLSMLRDHMPDVLEAARSTLEKEGIYLDDPPPDISEEAGPYRVLSYARRSKRRSLVSDETDGCGDTNDNNDGGVASIISHGKHHVVAFKPYGVVCHRSAWTHGGEKGPKPMLQRVRDATGRKVNLVHRLDRGASGCLLLAYADNDGDGGSKGSTNGYEGKYGPTAVLARALQGRDAVKTYVALVRGDGIIGEADADGEDLTVRGWFEVNCPVKDEWGRWIEDAVTDVHFVAGTTIRDDEVGRGAGGVKIGSVRAGLVLARPRTGRWHQVRQHLASSAAGFHPILGDATHGLSRTNREWQEKRDLPPGRVCLHLARLTVPPTEFVPGGIDTVCPLPDDMVLMLERHMPDVLDSARSVLAEEGVTLSPGR